MCRLRHKAIDILFYVLCFVVYVFSYNVDVKKAGIATGEAGSQFGYSVAIVRKPGWSGPRSVDFYEKTLLIGTPNRTVNNINGYGGLARCDSSKTQNIVCNHIDMAEKGGICEKLKGDSKLNRSDCEQDQRLGATIAINHNFQKHVYSTSTLPMVTKYDVKGGNNQRPIEGALQESPNWAQSAKVCAPGWKNVYLETESKQNYMVGMCLKLRDELEVLLCPRKDFAYCWPFWTFEGKAFDKGQPYYAFAQGGLSAAFTTDGISEVTGGPGVKEWRGGYKLTQLSEEKLIDWDQESTLYYGYSIATAEFHDEGNYVVAGCPNFHAKTQGHTGKVEILKGTQKREVIEFGIWKSCEKIETLSFDDNGIMKDQVGTKFGAAVHTVDVTGDGVEEIFVGAPYYSGKMVDEGRVFVYTMKLQTACGPIGILSGGARHPMYKDKVEFARFGTSISSAGDLNADDYNDVAIGAPYEDEGKGAVYIYHGQGPCNCIMEDKFSQRIAGETIRADLRGFGWSLYGNEDIDNNGYPDLLVGAYRSDSAVMFRTRPIVGIKASIDMNPNPIPLNPESLDCSQDGMLCFTIYVEFDLKGLKESVTNIQNTNITWTLNADTLYKASEGGASRVIFRDSGKSTLMENITISTNSRNERTYTLDVLKYKNKTEPRDAWKKVRIEGKFELIESNADDFNTLDPILNESSDKPLQEDIEFDIKCESVEKCSSDLQTQVNMSLIGGLVGSDAVTVNNDTAIYVGLADELQIETVITNLVNYSYRANFTSKVSADLKWHRSGGGQVSATCKSEKKSPFTIFNCSADSIKMNRNENFEVTAHFDISRESLISGNRLDSMKEYIDVKVEAAQAYADLDPSNNVFERRIPVKLKYDIDIYEDITVSDQFRYKGDINSDRVFNLQHIYYVRNNGPSFLPKTYVNISVPVQKGDVVIAEITGYPTAFCSIAGSDSQIQTTKAPTATVSTTERFTIPSPNPNRRKREANQSPSSMSQTDNGASSRNITCDNPEYHCEIIECLIKDFETSDKPQIQVTLDVYEKTLAQEKGILEVHYTTEAKVTDPAIWFVGKVVPWNMEVSATKTTLFVVEQSTLVDEIDLWIIIVSIIGALVLLIVLILILWKCGFFKRKKHNEVQKWKQDSLYKRRSQMPSSISPNSDQPYSPIETKQEPDEN